LRLGHLALANPQPTNNLSNRQRHRRTYSVLAPPPSPISVPVQLKPQSQKEKKKKKKRSQKARRHHSRAATTSPVIYLWRLDTVAAVSYTKTASILSLTYPSDSITSSPEIIYVTPIPGSSTVKTVACDPGIATDQSLTFTGMSQTSASIPARSCHAVAHFTRPPRS
jgi:hypothetical protein